MAGPIPKERREGEQTGGDVPAPLEIIEKTVDLALTNARLGGHEEAEGRLTEASKRWPEDPRVDATLGHVYQMWSDKEGLTDVERVAKLRQSTGAFESALAKLGRKPVERQEETVETIKKEIVRNAQVMADIVKRQR